MSSRLLIWLCCAGAIVLACGPHLRPGDSSARASEARSRAQPMATTMPAKSLVTSLDISVQHGVTLTLHVTNVREKQLELTFSDGQTHDFAVLDATGREVWRWGNGRMFTQSLQNRLLQSRETATYQEHWDAREQTGTFVAVATLRSSSHPLEERVEFTLP